MKGAITSVSLFDNNNQSVISLEEKLKRRADKIVFLLLQYYE